MLNFLVSKKNLDEKVASASFVLDCVKGSDKAWLEIKKHFQNNFYNNNFVFLDDNLCALNLSFALIALGIASVESFFPQEQSKRLALHIMSGLRTESTENYAVKEVIDYLEAYENGGNRQKGLEGVAIILLNQWLGKNIDKILIKGTKDKPFFINPIATDIVSMFLNKLSGYWENVYKNYNLIK